MRKLILTLIFMLVFAGNAMAADLHDLHKAQDRILPDKLIHFGAGYIISGELQKHTKLNKYERFLAVLGIAYAKEKLIDDNLSESDIWATCIGGAVQITW